VAKRRRRRRRRSRPATPVLVALAAGAAALGVALAGTGIATERSCASPRSTPAPTAVAGYSGEQLRNARLIMEAGEAAGFGVHGQTLAVMTAAGESSLRALPYGDAAGPDSRGLFQQRRPWGTLAERMDPTTSATLFYRRLAAVPGWRSMTPTAAAHAVQVNADPDHYARYWAPAKRIVASLAEEEPAPARC
jgi:hypothetical protein